MTNENLFIFHDPDDQKLAYPDGKIVCLTFDELQTLAENLFDELGYPFEFGADVATPEEIETYGVTDRAREHNAKLPCLFQCDFLDPYMEDLQNPVPGSEDLHDEIDNCGVWGIAKLEWEYADIELNITHEPGRLIPEYFICLRHGPDAYEDWESFGYMDRECHVDFSDPDWRELLRQDMYDAMMDYAGKMGWYLDMPFPEKRPVYNEFSAELCPVEPDDEDLLDGDLEDIFDAAMKDDTTTDLPCGAEPNRYLTLISWEDNGKIEHCYDIKRPEEIFARIDMYDCYDEDLSLWLLTDKGPLPCDWHGTWHDCNDPLKMSITLRETGNVLDLGWGTDH